MRCPKCHYLSFEPEARCRNCGYGMPLDDQPDDGTPAPAAAPDLHQGQSADGPLIDLLLRSDPSTAAVEPELARRHSDPFPDLPMREPDAEPRPASAPRGPFDAPEAILVRPPARSVRESRPAPAARRSGPRTSTPPAARRAAATVMTAELPLFVTRSVQAAEGDLPAGDADAPDDAPLVEAPVQPRPPLAVRKPAPDTTAGRTSTAATGVHPRPNLPLRKPGPLHHDLLEDLQRIEHLERKAAADAQAATRREWTSDGAGPASRLGAAVIDALLIGAVSAAVLTITLRWLDLPMAQAGLLPVVPTAAFLLLVGVGYLLIFTAAGGQTIGKMTTGIRVVPDEARMGETLSVRQALYREILTVPSVLVLGAGFIPGLVGERRALHDRLAHTRVVRA